MLLAATREWPHWLAATSITFLLWWTIASPLLLLGAAVLAARRPRLRSLLTIAICAPPLLVLLPLTAMGGGVGAVAAGAAAALEAAAVALAVVAMVAPQPRPASPPAEEAAPVAEPPLTWSVKLGWAAVFCAVAGGMVGSLAFLTQFS